MKLVVLTEYSKKIGFGHLSRTLSLADCFYKNNWDVKFLIRGAGDDFDKKLDYSFELCEWDLVEDLNLRDFDVVLIDSYCVTKDKLNCLVETIEWPVTIIDSKLNYPNKGLLVFGSIYADLFTFDSSIDILGGKDYLLFRKDFVEEQNEDKVIGDIHSVLVSLGNFCNPNFVEFIISEVEKQFENIDIHVVSGIPILSNNKNIYKYSFLETKDYINLIQKVDFIICNGGQTLNEAIALRIPSISVELIDNQRMNSIAWASLGNTISVGSIEESEFELKFKNALYSINNSSIRRELVENCKKSVDLNGVQRIYNYIVDGIKSN